MSFLVKRGKTYHLHVKVPVDLIPVFGSSVLTVSLETHIKPQVIRLQYPATDPGHCPGGEQGTALHAHLSRAFGAYLRNKVKIKDPKKTFHSFRHTVTDTLWKAMVQESIIEELTGRAGKTQTSRRYLTRSLPCLFLNAHHPGSLPAQLKVV